MRGWGIALAVLGFVGLIAGMVMDTSVTSGLNRIENIGLLSRQASILTVSALAFLTGCVLIGFAAVCDAVQRLGPAIAAHIPRQPTPQSRREGQPMALTPPPSEVIKGDGTKTCQKCYALAMVDAGRCPRCGSAFPDRPAIEIGTQVRSSPFGTGMVLEINGETSMVKFETIEQPITINTAALTVVGG